MVDYVHITIYIAETKEITVSLTYQHVKVNESFEIELIHTFLHAVHDSPPHTEHPHMVSLTKEGN